jgi:ABC-type glycerol-3-phosphate transport system permease component
VEEAAGLDGASRFGVFLRIAVPMAASGVVTCTLFCVLFAWNDFLFPAFLTTLHTKPLSVALLSAYGTKDITWGTLGALAHFAVLPIVAASVLLNRYFVQGVARGVN